MPSFSIVPVLDLKGGTVVHARVGDRARYRPLRSRLTAGSDPVAVLGALLALAAFRSAYIADLDAIEGAGDQGAIIGRLASRFSGTRLWVDAGLGCLAAAQAVAARGALPVLGSESWTSAEALGACLEALGSESCLLSLDYRGDRLIGPSGLDHRPQLWPSRVIVMTLARVGTGAGPDLDRLAKIKALAGARSVVAAGGVRGVSDLVDLKELGCSGVLVASALHDGRLTGNEIAGAQE